MDFERRDKIRSLILNAITLEQCEKAEKALQEWLGEYPQDWGMYDLVSTLATLKAALPPTRLATPGKVSV